MKDQLFLLKPGFHNAGLGPLYCGDSVSIEGLLSFCPDLRTLVDVHYLDFQRPRSPLVSWLGKDHQSVPVIILADATRVDDPGVAPRQAQGRRYIADEKLIRRYLSSQYDLPQAG
ncbi:DUF3088 family protein [Phenylobacterium sp.]|uniref:DUF3088 family protein n=1 Tax=Phenylobacterium sp. TaxID=1871053 RepID=UPI00286B8F5C|nr:DUF3088 family protein [Phenylobacterium sp.]